MNKYRYEVNICEEYYCPTIEIDEIRSKYNRWFSKLKEAKKYLISIKKELKEIVKSEKERNNTITLNIERWIQLNESHEEYDQIVYSVYLCGRY